MKVLSRRFRNPSQSILVRLSLLCLTLAGLVVYWHSLDGAFLFDDHTNIAENNRIHSLSWPWAFLSNERRPVLHLTLAVNYALGGLDPIGYHVINLIGHLLAAFLLFGIIRRTCLLPCFSPNVQRDSLGIALATSLLWVVHPLQTESVTYIIQRAESLMGMFFLMTVYASVRYFISKNKEWAGCAVMACLLGGLIKEVIIAAPVVIILYDRLWVSGSFRQTLKNHRWLYQGLILVAAVMLTLLFVTKPEDEPTAGFLYSGITPWTYALTQAKVLIYYLRLIFWPHPLIFDYNWKPVAGLKEALPGVLAVSLIAGLSLWSHFKSKRFSAAGFLGLSYFVILMPSSSIIPLKDVAFEHRLYLPLASILLAVVLGVRVLLYKWIATSEVRFKWGVTLTCLCVTGFGGMTIHRNLNYGSELRMWQDVVAKNPENARANNNYGRYLYENRQYQKAIQYYEKALALDPDYADANLNLGSLLAQLNRLEESIVFSQKALEIQPDYAVAHNNLGAALIHVGEYQQAVFHLRQALALGFNKAGVHKNMGQALDAIGESRQAIDHLREAIRLDPYQKDAQDLLAEILRREQRRPIHHPDESSSGGSVE